MQVCPLHTHSLEPPRPKCAGCACHHRSPFGACSEDNVPQRYSLTNNSGHSSFGDFSSPDYLDNVTLEDLGEPPLLLLAT
jgi:hypothetical protein